MVFESIVADLLNKYLGQYVRDLDASQLKIGIWGGNVVLENLELKDTALDDLDLPVKVVRGYLGKLTLSIPWKNLYNESTIVEINDLHVVCKPNFDIKYNSVKEEKALSERKQRQIENIEEARRLKEERKKVNEDKRDENQDSFTEKLATNVIKNLQITITDIHIRYEDSVSDPVSPFAVGITLDNLSAQTTDGNFVPQVIKEAVTIINKLLKLDNLALYWNKKENSDDISTEEWLKFSREQISRKNYQPPDMKYILQPIVASKMLKINTKPGLDMNIPKIFANLMMEELGLVLFRSQYHSLVELLESFDRMSRNIPFRKYRPPVPLASHPADWWRYCISSILEEDVRRRANMWSWHFIQNHRALCRKYKEIHKERLRQKNPSKDILRQLKDMEDQLNVVSITIFRQLAENEVMHEKKNKKDKSSIFSFFSSKEKKKEQSKLEELMGADKEKEMKKLYEAIGYTENEAITAFSLEYNAVVFQFELKRIAVTLKDDCEKRGNVEILRFSLDDIQATFKQRPSAQAISVSAKIQSMKLFGTRTEHEIPVIIRNVLSLNEKTHLQMVELQFETNPLHSENIDHVLSLECQPLEIIYDANSITQVVSFFKPPEDVLLQDLQNKAYTTFEEFKVSSTAGLLHAMEKRKIMDMDINLHASYLIIPEKGRMAGCQDMVVVDFGSLHLKSVPSQLRDLNPKDIENIEEVQLKAYDRFVLQLNDLQVLLCRDGEDFLEMRTNSSSLLHILHPLSFQGNIANSIVPNDPRLKQLIVDGVLTSIELTVSDNKINRAVKLFNGLPLPKTMEMPPDAQSTLKTIPSYTNLAHISDVPVSFLDIPVSIKDSDSSGDILYHTPPESSILSIDGSEPTTQFTSGIANQVKVELGFVIKKVKLSISRANQEFQTEEACIEVCINDIGLDVRMRRWDMFVDGTIGRFVFSEMTWGDEGEPLDLFKTPADSCMLKLSYRKCEFDQSMTLGPSYFYSEEAHLRALQYKSEFEATQQIINLEVAMLYVVLHQEAMFSVLELVTQVLEPLQQKVDQLPTQKLKKSLSLAGSKLNLAVQESLLKKSTVDKETDAAHEHLRNKVGLTEDTKLKFTASMSGLDVFICSARVDLARAVMRGLFTQVFMQEKKTEVTARVSDLLVEDKVGKTNFSKILSMRSDQVFGVEIVVYNEATTGANLLDMSAVDMSVKLTVGQIRAVFLNRFVMDLMVFIDNFEEAKKKIIEAGAAAKEKATEAVSQMKDHNSRIQLNIMIKAPVIIIPVNSLAELSLMVDLGELHIFNSFKTLNKDKRPKDNVVTDNIVIKMASLKLMKALIKDGESVIAQRAIVEPMTLKLSVVRSLTPANHSVPGIYASGSLKAITLVISEEDISVAVSIVLGNMAEGQKMQVEKAKNQLSAKDTVQLPPDRLASIYEEPEGDTSYGKTIFKFDMEKIVVQMYLKPPDMTFEEEFLERDPNLFLSEFVVGRFIVDGVMYSDNALKVELVLDTLQLYDKRPVSADTLTLMMDHFPEQLLPREDRFVSPIPGSDAKMVQVKFEQSKSSDRNLDLNVNNLMSILNIEFLMVLWRTMLATIPKTSQDNTDSVSSSPTHSLTSSDEDEMSFTTDLDETIAVEHVDPPELRVQLKVKNPQIVLLADAKDAKTNALFFTTDINCQYLEVNGIQKVMGTMSNTEMYSTSFRKEHRSDISTVFSLDMINLHSSAPLGQKPHVHVNSTVVKLSVSPKTIRTLSACASQTAVPETLEGLRENQKQMAQLWNFKDLCGKRMWYLNTPAQDVLGPGSFVMTRTIKGNYTNGFLAKKDTHFTVYFYPEGSISHLVNDVTSVVVDLPPAEEKLFLGENVIALHSEEDGYRPGRIVEVWKGTKEEIASEAMEDNQADDWSPCHSTDSLFNKYLVRFYHDCSEKYYVGEQVRHLQHPVKGAYVGVGAGVYARYKDGFYYRGIVYSVHGHKVNVHFKEINDFIEHDIDDPSAVILNMTPQENQIRKLFKVIASKAEAIKGYHPGKVTTIQGNRGYRSYVIRFEDGSTNQVPVTKLLVMPKASHDALPTIGTYVYSRVARDSPLYEKGIVADLDERIYIKHLNGRKLAHDRKNFGFVIRNIVPLTGSLYIGQEVIGQVDSDDLRMYLGEIREVIQSAKAKKYLVQFTDGTTKKLTPGKIRIVPTLGVSSTEVNNSSAMVSARREQLIVEVEGVCLRVEGYLGGMLTPMLRFDLKLYAEIHDWSTRLNANSTVSMNASYYNEMVAEWEPFVEPIIRNNREQLWQLNIEYSTADDLDEDDDNSKLLQKPMTSLKAESFQNLELTLTKASLALLKDLGDVFGSAVECANDQAVPVIKRKDPFTIQNKLGVRVHVRLNELLKTFDGKDEILLANSTSVGFDESKEGTSNTKKMPIISVQVEGYSRIPNIAIKRQRTVIYDLIPTNILSSTGAFSVIIEVATNDGQRVITIRSPLQIRNHFPMPLDFSYVNKENKNVKLAKVDSSYTYAVPLLPTYHATFFVKPAGFAYKESSTPLVWSNLAANNRQLFTCTHPDDDNQSFYIQVVTEEEKYTSVHGMLDAVPKYLIHCYPPITLHNYLPYPINYQAEGMAQMESLAGGDHWPLFTAFPDERSVVSIELPDYFGQQWFGNVIVGGLVNLHSKTSTFSMQSGNDNKMELGAYTVLDGGINVSIYSPYWLLNKTGKTLLYQASGTTSSHEHPTNEQGAVMFHIRSKKARKARVCVSNCEWSDEFSLDTVGSGGSVKSEGLRKRMFEIGVGISMSYFSLTKIVTFTPLRILTNHTKYVISMAESDSETSEWHNVKPNESVPYWPTRLPPKNLFLNINGYKSVKFDPEAGKTLLLKFQSEVGGICVNYQEKDSTSLLSFHPYFSGSAPVRIENLCKKISMISYKQTDYFKGHVLLYGQSILYTWDDPTLPHELMCAIIEVNESQTKIKLDVNDFGRMKAGSSGAIYWVLFLDGLQRVLMFTDNFKSAYCANQEQTLRPTQEICLNLEGLGLSLVNCERRMEIGYLSVTKSQVIWEQQKNNRWKCLTNQMCEALEDGYDKHQSKKLSKQKILEVEVDFERMFITKPEKIKIRRTFHSGIGFKYIVSPNRMQVRATVSSLQFDSHVPGSTFLTVIHEVEPPLSVASDSAPKPFFELSLTTNIGDGNIVNEVSYLKVLIQEMDIRIDKGFILSLMELFNSEKIRGNQKARYTYDLSIVKQKLEESSEFQAAKKDKRYVFNFFHLSPLKIHVSFSMTGGHSIQGSEASIAQNDVFSLLLQSVGVAFTEIQDVEFKLACFEISSLLLSSSQLNDSIMKHYQNQAIKQLYVLVLGLDVLGNPYGLISGVGEGAKNFFYEPYQGLIQGPEEFAEGLAYGVKSLVGGTVGGVSGAVSKITGTVGKGLAALTMDDEYQQKRRQRMSQRPTNLGQGLAKGGTGLVKGIFSGVTGIVVKPYQGAKAEGAGGFFKGIGKGLVGVVARPVGGVVDMASSTFDGLKSTTSGVKTVKHLRVTRVFHADKVLRAFNEYEAEGNKILMEVDKARYSKSDCYMVHLYLPSTKSYLILSNKSVTLVERNEILKEWESEWRLQFNDIKGEPVVEGNKITFNLHVTTYVACKPLTNYDYFTDQDLVWTDFFHECDLLSEYEIACSEEDSVNRKAVFKKAVNCRFVTLQSEAIAKWFIEKWNDAKML